MNKPSHRLYKTILTGIVLAIFIVVKGFELVNIIIGLMVCYICIDFIYSFFMKLPINISGGPILYTPSSTENLLLRVFILACSAFLLGIIFYV